MRYNLRSLLVACLIPLFASCSAKREEQAISIATDTLSSSQGAADTSAALSPDPSAPASSGNLAVPPLRRNAPPVMRGDTVVARELSPSEQFPHADRTIPIGEAPLVASAQLATLHPVPANYFVEKVKNRDLPTVHRSIALVRSRIDTSKTIRSSIFDQDERTSYMLIRQISELRTKGSVTQYVEGQPVTAYYVNVNGAGGSKAYIASKRVATITLLLSDHTLMQLREDNVSSADHLLEVAKLIDVNKFNAMQQKAQ